MNIGIIGCGWLGKDLAKSLINQEYKVFGTRTTIEGIQELEALGIKGTQLVLKNNTVETSTKSTFEEADVLIVSITPRIRHRSNEEAIEEMKTLSDFLNQLPKQPHIIYLNSTAIYNASIEDCTEEVEDLKTPYSDFEKSIQTIKNHTILRLSGLVGPDRIIVNRMAGKERAIPKSACINLVAKEDVIRAIESVIKRPDKTVGETFNVCSSNHPFKHIFYTEMCIAAGLTPPKFLLNENQEPKKVSNNKIREVLKLHFQFEKIEHYYNEILN